MNTFAERLRQTRDLRQFTQAELARASGVSQSAIANYENGNRKTTKHIFKLAQALRVEPAWLADGVGAMENLVLSDVRPAGGYRNQATHGASDTWPFKHISANQWHRLSDQERALVEATLTTMVQTLLKAAPKR